MQESHPSGLATLVVGVSKEDSIHYSLCAEWMQYHHLNRELCLVVGGFV